jgi:ATP-dependent RNA helicase DeaD
MSDTAAFDALPPVLGAALERRGFTQLTEVQQAVLADGLAGQSLRVSSKTGSGKTVALGLVVAPPLLEAMEAGAPGRPLVLVVAPTRELAQQVREELSWLFADVRGVDVVSVTGGTDPFAEKRRLERGPAIVVGTPGRLLDHAERGALDLGSVRDVVLDEADRMLDMGFREELTAIMERLPEGARRHLVSATFPDEVLRFADRFQGDAVPVEGTALGEANADIEHTVHLVRPRERYGALVNTLLLAQGQRTLLFVRTRADATELAEALAADGFSAMPFSGDLPQAQRTRTLAAFRHGLVKVLVATDVAARGIDVADIALVVHHDVAHDAETYVHRSGRTGRAGQTGRSVALVPPAAEGRVRRLMAAAKVEAKWMPVPDAKKVERTIVKRSRRHLRAVLRDGPDVAEARLAYATELLGEYDPATLVACLLSMSEPKLPRPPMNVEAIEPRGEGAARGPREAGRGGPRRREDDVVFTIAWGGRDGATPARVLAHVCRRGNIRGPSIGKVEVGPSYTTFGVARDVARSFETAARRPDPREPEAIIRRARESHRRDDAPPTRTWGGRRRERDDRQGGRAPRHVRP